MGRPWREEYKCGIYHVIARGNNKVVNIEALQQISIPCRYLAFFPSLVISFIAATTRGDGKNILAIQIDNIIQ